MRYVSYSKAQFEYQLIRIRKENRLGYWYDCSKIIAEQMLHYSNPIILKEFVYYFPTNVSNIGILLYSSVDFELKRTRDCGSDAVRLVYEKSIGNERFYSKIGKKYRVAGLFGNLEAVLLSAIKEASFERNWVQNPNLTL